MSITTARSRNEVWSAVQTLLGWIGLIALCAGGYYVVGLLPRSVAPGPDVIVFLERRSAHDSLAWMALAGVLFLFLFLASVRTTKGLVLVAIVFLAGAGGVVWELYGRVAAIAFQGDSVELRYVWPRPAERLSPGEIISATYEARARASDDYPMEYTLHLRTRRGVSASFSDPSLSDVQRALRGIAAVQGR